MNQRDYIQKLRRASRKLIRELGMLELNQPEQGRTHSHWHALMEIEREPGITMSKLSDLLLLTPSAISRIVDVLLDLGWVETVPNSLDKRQKDLFITPLGLQEITRIDDFSNTRIVGALHHMTEHMQQEVLEGITAYGKALEKQRLIHEKITLRTLPTSRDVRRQVIQMIEGIQVGEFSIPVTPELNENILKAETTFHFYGKCHFWYAVSGDGEIIGSIGLKKLSETEVEIKKFFVHKNFRGMGVAQKLIHKAVQSIAVGGFTTIYLGTVSVLHAAQRFYVKKGFEEIQKSDLPGCFDICPVDTHFFRGDVETVKKSILAR